MKRAVLLPLAGILCLAVGWVGGYQYATRTQALPLPANACELHFSPNGGCTEAIVRAINGASSSVLVQAYYFTSKPIAEALLNAHKRGVSVSVILDKSQRTEKYSAADFLANSGITTLIDSKHGIAHSKVMVIDYQTVITGSFNFTKAAEERNVENLLVIRDTGLAQKYTDHWRQHATHSEPYKGKLSSR